MYPSGYSTVVTDWRDLLVEARRDAGLSQHDLASLAGTSRPTLSAYEHGRKTPSADTLQRLLAAAGRSLTVAPVVSWREVPVGHGRWCAVPDRLWRLEVADVFADVVLPVELDWSTPGRRFSPRDRRQRARLYEVLLREGSPADILRWIDGALLVDVWADMVLPRRLRTSWQPLIDAVLDPAPGAARVQAPRLGAAS